MRSMKLSGHAQMGGMVARRNTPEGARKLMLRTGRLYNIFVKNCRERKKSPIPEPYNKKNWGKCKCAFL